MLAEPADIVVINDFLKGESKAFEKQFLKAVSGVRKEGRMVVYLSDHMLSACRDDEEAFFKEGLDTYRMTRLDIEKYSFR